MPAKLGTKPRPIPALIINRSAVTHEKLVYIARANKRFSYHLGKSSIAYIGTTKNGIDRITGSAAEKARDLLENHGVNTLSFCIVTCRPEKNVKSWNLLEKALIIRFREIYGEVPFSNDIYKNAPRGKEFDYFTDNSLDNVLDIFEEEP